jgi:hypothetical protein
MNPQTSLELAELRQHDLRADATHARLATHARRARRQRSRLDWLRRIARPRPRYARTLPARPATVTPMARPRPFDDLASRLASDGPAAMHGELIRLVEVAAARGATPSLLAILADRNQPDVARQRAFGRIAVELATPRPDSAQHRPDQSDAA